MFEIECLKVGEMAINCYVLYENGSGNCIIIDPGEDSEYIKDFITKKLLTPIYILSTHGHSDHVGSVFELKLTYNCPLGYSIRDIFLIKKASLYNKYLKSFVSTSLITPDLDLDKEMPIEFDGNKISVIKTPGHTPGSVCLYCKQALFVGDLFFSDGSLGGYDHKYSSYSELKKSIIKIFHLPAHTNVYPGHGVSTTLAKMKNVIGF